MIGFGLSERVVERDVDDVLDGLVGIELGDEHPIAIRVEHVRHPGQHDVVVVDEGDEDRPMCLGGRHAVTVTPLGVYCSRLRGG